LGASLTVGSGRAWECDGGANVAAGADLDVAAGGTVLGPVTNDGTITQTGGSVQVTGSNGLTGSGTMNVSAGTLAARQIRQRAITIDGSGLVKLHVSGATGPSTSVTESLNISGAGKLDLTDKKLVVAAGAGAIGSWNGSAYTGITGMIQSGRGNGSWNGSGIVTSDTRAVGNNDLCSIGVASASQVKSIASTATAPWAGQTVLGTDVLVMFTWGGDANLDGKINIDDYGRIDGNVASSGSVFGWFNGDFNYDGKINIDDYGIIDGNINRQGAPFSTTSLDIAAVPEAAAGMVALAGLSVRHVGRRRRRRE
jgi:hypothetical protein